MSEGVLQQIIDRQVEFQEQLKDSQELRYGFLSDTERLVFIAVAMAKEAHEFLDCFAWKAHKRNYLTPADPASKALAVVELVDVLHYLVAGFIELGYTTEEAILELFNAKQGINRERQADGY